MQKKTSSYWYSLIPLLIACGIVLLMLLIIPLLLPDYTYNGGFQALSQIEKYAQEHDERHRQEQEDRRWKMRGLGSRIHAPSVDGRAHESI